MHRPNKTMDCIAKCLAWRAPISSKHTQDLYINLQEAEAVVHELERRIAQRLRNVHVISLSDSRVVVAFSKGRGSSKALNRILKRFMAYRILYGLEVCLIWIGSKSCTRSHQRS